MLATPWLAERDGVRFIPWARRICNAPGALFKGTILMDADLTNADLRGAFFPGAIFREARITGAEVAGADFRGAIFREARITGAEVAGADFRGALGLTAEQVCSTHGWQGAQFDADLLAQTQALCGARR